MPDFVLLFHVLFQLGSGGIEKDVGVVMGRKQKCDISRLSLLCHMESSSTISVSYGCNEFKIYIL